MSQKDHQASSGKGDAKETHTVEELQAKLAVAEATSASKAEEIAHLRELIQALLELEAVQRGRIEDMPKPPVRLFGSWTNGLACVGAVVLVGLIFGNK